MKRYYLTFGNTTERSHKYQVVHAPDYHAARARVFEEYGAHVQWAFLYPQEEFLGRVNQPRQYGLTPLPTELTTLRLVETPIEVVPASPEAAP